MRFSFKKFLSRKFLIAIVGMIVGLAVSLGADASEIQQIAGAVVSAVSAMSYIFGEAMVDSAAVTVINIINHTTGLCAFVIKSVKYEKPYCFIIYSS